MRPFYFITILLVLLADMAGAQSFTDSNLPIVIINTNNVAIVDDPRIKATMKIIYRGNGQRNYISDQDTAGYLDYNGNIDIEIRGSSSQYNINKTQYGFSTKMADGVTNNNVKLLGMPAEHDWILNSMIYDSALIRDYLCFNLSRQIGEYASRTAYCEVVINREYRGLYLLDEKIKADDNRVDVYKITVNDNYMPEVTGGYITKADKTTGGDPVAWKMYAWNGGTVDFIHEFPKPETVTELQANYIKRQFNLFESAITSGDYSATTGVPSVIDMPSFIDYMIISELSSNADSYQFSTYFHKDRNGKIRSGPIWDSDLTFNNDLHFWGYDRSKFNVWQFSNGDNEGPKFWRDMFYNNKFRCYLSKRWNELILPGQPLNLTSINNLIDSTVASISEAIFRENIKWNNVKDHQKRIAEIKSFLEKRIPWITANLGNWSECSNVAVPELVISRIMYHPDTTISYPLSEEREFIEITNAGDNSADLTGIYFGGTGFSFQFPAGSSLAPGASLILASNFAIFFNQYKMSPNSQYARHLSNKSQKLVLADAFGNVIDSVTYHDSAPWPDADGNGYHLKLIDPLSDNSIAENWTASNEILISGDETPSEKDLFLYPNPVTDLLGINTIYEIRSISLFDLTGRELVSEEIVNSFEFYIEMRKYDPGIYFVKIITIRGTYICKVIKV